MLLHNDAMGTVSAVTWAGRFVYFVCFDYCAQVVSQVTLSHETACSAKVGKPA